MIGQTEATEYWRNDAHRVDGATNVVVVAREREPFSATAPTDCIARLEDLNRQASSGQHYTGGQAVRPGADDYRVERGPGHVTFVCSHRAAIMAIAPATHIAKSVLPITGRRLPWTLAAALVGEKRLPHVTGC